MIHFVKKLASMNDIKLMIRTVWQLQKIEFIYTTKIGDVPVIIN